MLAGHFGVAGIVKAWRPEIPMAALLVASQVPDLVFAPLAALGAESMAPADPGLSGYGSLLITAPFSHALVSNVVFAVVVGLLVHVFLRGRWGCDAGWVLGGVVFSHWLLDLLVHRPDMPLLPGGSGPPLLGLGLWEAPAAAAVVEGALVAAGALLYGWRTLRDLPDHRGRAWAYSAGVGLLLAGSFVFDLFAS